MNEHSNRRDLYTISLAFFLAFLGAGASQPFVVAYLQEVKGLTLAQASFAFSLVYFTFVVFRFFIGFFTSFLGLYTARLLGMLTYAAFPIFLLAGQSYAAFIIGSVLWGIGAPLFWTGALVQLMNTSAPTRYGTATGILRGAVMTALLIGGYVLPFIYARKGYTALFTAAAVLPAIGVLAMVCSPNRHMSGKRPDLATFLRVMKQKETLLVALFLLCSGLMYGVLLNGFKTHIETHCGKHWLSYMLPMWSLAGILSSILGGRISDRIGRWPTFAFGFALGAVGMAVAWWTTNPFALMVATFLIGAQFSIVPVSAFAWIGDTTTPDERASVMGYVVCFRDLGIAAAILSRSVITEWGTVLMISTLVSCACACVSYWERLRKARQ